MLKRTKIVSLVVMIGFVAVMLYVWQRTQSMRMRYAVSDLRERRDTLLQENTSLQLQISSYKSLEKLDQTAKERGLAVPDASKTIYLEGE